MIAAWVWMLLGGLIGGVIQSYWHHQRWFVLPARAKEGGLSLGFLGDAAGGGVVAFVTAGVATFVCKEELVSALGLGTKPPSGSTPLFVVAIAVGVAIGFAWRRVLPRLSDGVVAAIGREVEKKTEVLSKKMDEKVDQGTKMANEPLQAALEILSRAIKELQPGQSAPVPAPPAPRLGGAGGMPAAAPPATDPLQALVEEYESKTKIADWVQRLARKEELASKMAAQGLAQGLTREALVHDFRSLKKEGYVLALASLMMVDPRPDDSSVLLSVSGGLERKHVRYRVVSAFGLLADRKYLPDDQRKAVKERIESFRKGADNQLLRRIDATLRRLG